VTLWRHIRDVTVTVSKFAAVGNKDPDHLSDADPLSYI